MTELLIIDDSPEDRAQVSRLLGQAATPFQIRSAEDSRAAYAALAEREADCILLDQFLHDENGIEILRKLRVSHPNCPVIMFTGMPSNENQNEALKLGASDFLDKARLTTTLLDIKISMAIERYTLKRNLEASLATVEAYPLTSDPRFSEAVRAADLDAAMARSFQFLHSMSSAGSATRVARKLGGAAGLQDRMPMVFRELVDTYAALLDPYLAQLIMADHAKPADAMQQLTNTLGLHDGGPRDLIDIHLAAVSRAAEGASPRRAEAYVTQGRFLALELMGMLVDYYRIRRGGSAPVER